MEEKNLELYNAVRAVPAEAKKTISGGKLNGMTDINPMWRIKKLTEQFGVAGFGWVAKIINSWTENGADGEVIVNVVVGLKVKMNGEWSDEIIGIGGSKTVQKEKGSLVSNDEGYKMAYTDAISVACKALGFGADVYWDKDNTKYTGAEKAKMITQKQIAEFTALGIRTEKTLQRYGVEKVEELTEEQAAAVIAQKKAYDAQKKGEQEKKQ